VSEQARTTENGRPGGLRAVRVSQSFEGVHALREVSLELRRHEVVGLIGPNGAGKTTLVNVLTGFYRPTGGTVELDGRDVTSWPPQRRVRAGLARTFQQGHVFGSMTVRENVEVSALGSGADAREARRRADELLAMLALADGDTRPASVLPHGEQRKLGVARAMAASPRYILVDEAAAGLPEADVAEFAAVIRRVRDEREAGVLLIDHNVGLIMDVCDRIHVLDGGRTLAEDSPDAIRANLDVLAAYLGRAIAVAGAEETSAE
jgi:branched-chain amino acid transport system ATP-binding protein